MIFLFSGCFWVSGSLKAQKAQGMFTDDVKFANNTPDHYTLGGKTFSKEELAALSGAADESKLEIIKTHSYIDGEFLEMQKQRSLICPKIANSLEYSNII